MSIEKATDVITNIIAALILGAIVLATGWVGALVLAAFDIDSGRIISDNAFRGEGPIVKLGLVLFRILLGIGIPIVIGALVLSIPAVVTWRIYQEFFREKKILFFTIVGVLLVGVGASIFFVREHRQNERREVLKFLDAFYLEDSSRNIIYIVKASEPLNCSIDLDVRQNRVVTKNGSDVYTIKTSLKIEKENLQLSDNPEYRESCLALYKVFVNTSDINFDVRLEADNRTLLDLSDNTLYACIPFGEEKRTCTSKQGKMISRVAPDRCIETSDRSQAGVLIDTYDCPKGVDRPIDIPFVSIKAKVPINEKPNSPEASVTLQKFRRSN